MKGLVRSLTRLPSRGEASLLSLRWAGTASAGEGGRRRRQGRRVRRRQGDNIVLGPSAPGRTKQTHVRHSSDERKKRKRIVGKKLSVSLLRVLTLLLLFFILIRSTRLGKSH